MTTIVSNGYYLIADHRRSRSESADTRNLLSIQVDSKDKASVVRKKKFSVHMDIAEKIFMLENPVPCSNKKAGNVIALACAGPVIMNDKFIKILLQYSKTDQTIDQFLKLLEMFQSLSGFMSCLMVTDNSFTIEVSVTGNTTSSVKFKYHTPGTSVMRGSGYGKIKNLYIPLAKTPPQDLFYMAQFMDVYTSPSYSVLGVRENQYFPFVLETPEVLETLTKDKIISFIKPNPNNAHNKCVTFEEDSLVN